MGCVFKAHKSERKDIYAKIRIFVGILLCYERFGMFKDRGRKQWEGKDVLSKVELKEQRFVIISRRW